MIVKNLNCKTMVSEVSRSVQEIFSVMFSTEVVLTAPVLLSQTRCDSKSIDIMGVILASEGVNECSVVFTFPEGTIQGLLKPIYGPAICERPFAVDQGVGEITNVISTKTKGRLRNQGYDIVMNHPKVSRDLKQVSDDQLQKTELCLPIVTTSGPFNIVFGFKSKNCLENIFNS